MVAVPRQGAAVSTQHVCCSPCAVGCLRCGRLLRQKRADCHVAEAGHERLCGLRYRQLLGVANIPAPVGAVHSGLGKNFGATPMTSSQNPSPAVR